MQESRASRYVSTHHCALASCYVGVGTSWGIQPMFTAQRSFGEAWQRRNVWSCLSRMCLEMLRVRWRWATRCWCACWRCPQPDVDSIKRKHIAGFHVVQGANSPSLWVVVRTTEGVSQRRALLCFVQNLSVVTKQHVMYVMYTPRCRVLLSWTQRMWANIQRRRWRWEMRCWCVWLCPGPSALSYTQV